MLINRPSHTPCGHSHMCVFGQTHGGYQREVRDEASTCRRHEQNCASLSSSSFLYICMTRRARSQWTHVTHVSLFYSKRRISGWIHDGDGSRTRRSATFSGPVDWCKFTSGSIIFGTRAPRRVSKRVFKCRSLLSTTYNPRVLIQLCRPTWAADWYFFSFLEKLELEKFRKREISCIFSKVFKFQISKKCVMSFLPTLCADYLLSYLFVAPGARSGRTYCNICAPQMRYVTRFRDHYARLVEKGNHDQTKGNILGGEIFLCPRARHHVRSLAKSHYAMNYFIFA